MTGLGVLCLDQGVDRFERAALLWNRLPHNVLAVLAGILITIAYRWLVQIDHQPVLGIMVVFRTLLWGAPLGGIGVAIAGAAEGDLTWKIFGGVVGFVTGTIAAAKTHPALIKSIRGILKPAKAWGTSNAA